ncbi:MAG: 5-oxoprolinase subunit PxpA [Bacteroidia bacterium]|nr:5-oxoprolinase subunit PxpA [Bacteroidia bacterium]
MLPRKIDINADVGEGIGNEAELMPYLSSCNIACGGHAGDESTMLKVVQLAKDHRVKIGAHPSFPDEANFGREVMEMSAAELYSALQHQIRQLMQILQNESVMLHHIKPHGALYNLAAKDEKIASIVIEVAKSIAQPVKLYAPYNSVIAKIAETEQIEVTYEAFADRNYNEDLSLVSRLRRDAVIEQKEAVYNHVICMLRSQKVKTLSGVDVPIKALTYCIHGDTKNAADIARYLAKKLNENNVLIR